MSDAPVDTTKSPPPGGLSVVPAMLSLKDKTLETLDRANLSLLASALTFDLLLAVLPLTVLLVGGLGYLVSAQGGGTAATSDLIVRFLPKHNHGMPNDPFASIENLLLKLPGYRSKLTWIALPLSFWFSSRVFAAMRACLSMIYSVRQRPVHTHFVLSYILGYLLAKAQDLAIVVVVLILALGNTITTTWMRLLTERSVTVEPQWAWLVTTGGHLAGQAIAFLFGIALFVLLYRYSSPKRLAWAAALLASLFTTLGFELAKRLYGLYLSYAATRGQYSFDLGAGAVLLFVLWLWYMSLVFMIGAALADVWDHQRRARAVARMTGCNGGNGKELRNCNRRTAELQPQNSGAATAEQRNCDGKKPRHRNGKNGGTTAGGGFSAVLPSAVPRFLPLQFRAFAVAVPAVPGRSRRYTLTFLRVIHVLGLLSVLQQPAPATAAAPARSYLFFVASSGSDEVALMRFDGKRLRVEHRTPVKALPGEQESASEIFQTDIKKPAAPVFADLNGKSVLLSSAHGFAPAQFETGPRGVTIAPDRRTYYVTTARGFPGGELLKVRIAADSGGLQPADTVQGSEALSSPGGVQVTPDGEFAWVLNSPPSGSADPSWISIVYLKTMVEVGRISACADARGGRFTADGQRYYTLCAGNDALLSIDVATMKIERSLRLSRSSQSLCGPQAFAISLDGGRVLVTCRVSHEIVEVNSGSWTLGRRIPVDPLLGEFGITPDGATVVTVNESTHSVAVIELNDAATAPGSGAVRSPSVTIDPSYRFAYRLAKSGDPNSVEILDVGSLLLSAMTPPLNGALAAVPLSAVDARPAAVAISPDGKYAFVSLARVATEPGTVQVIDIARRTAVAALDFGRALAGVTFWKTDP